MIFVAGIHGVGKTTFCNELSNILGIPNFSASELIKSWKKTNTWGNEKLVQHVDENQAALINAVYELKELRSNFIMDGHFVLLNSFKKFVNVEFSIFDELKIRGMILIESNPDTVAQRLSSRDNTKWDVGLIQKFMMEERKRALEYSQHGRIPCITKQNSDNLKIDDRLLNELSSWKEKSSGI